MSEIENKTETKTETKAKTKAKGKQSSAWNEMRRIRLDKSLGGDKKCVFVGVNGKKYQVPTGKEWEVPLPIYEVLKRMEVQMDILDGVREKIAKETEENMK